MLYQTVRPESLKEISGNKALIESLEMLIRSMPELRPHAFLLYGESGCGKTTIARILAQEFGAIGLDVHEYNAANTRGIDTGRHISQFMHITPMLIESKAKVFILDESHQMTPQCQEALLKATEDIPNHCYFIFCTTDPDSIVKTLRNRCAAYEVSRISVQEIESLIFMVAKAYDKDVSESVLKAISKAAEGVPRASLVMLEQVIGLSEEHALNLLSTQGSEETRYIDLCRALTRNQKGRWGSVRKLLTGVQPSNVDGCRKAVLGYLNSCILRSEDSTQAKRFAEMIDVLSQETIKGSKAVLSGMMFYVSRL